MTPPACILGWHRWFKPQDHVRVCQKCHQEEWRHPIWGTWIPALTPTKDDRRG